eukprot:1159185-Pelagomonas_calceolata.AAC.7
MGQDLCPMWHRDQHLCIGVRCAARTGRAHHCCAARMTAVQQEPNQPHQLARTQRRVGTDTL